MIIFWSCFLLNFIGSAIQGRDVVMHPEMSQSLVSLHSTIEAFLALPMDPLGLHHANHHMFPI
jgi:hypothetical protein